MRTPSRLSLFRILPSHQAMVPFLLRDDLAIDVRSNVATQYPLLVVQTSAESILRLPLVVVSQVLEIVR